MNRATVETFRRNLRSLRQSYSQTLTQLAKDESRRLRVSEVTEQAEGEQIALEAHTRLYLLDPLLRYLGWVVEETDRMVIEDGVDPHESDSGDHRRRLDYHGRDSETGVSLLVVEAKRANVELPAASTPREVIEFISQEIANIRNVKATSKSAAWRKILSSSIDYATRVKNHTGTSPKRFLLTNGNWFIVFKDVESTLLSTMPDPAAIEIFVDLDDADRRAHEFTALLSYFDLADFIPIQHPSALKDFIPEGHDVVCSKSIEVSYTKYGDRQPLQSVRVSIWVRLLNGKWIQFAKQYGKEFLIISEGNPTLEDSLAEPKARAAELLNELRAQRPLRFAQSVDFDDYSDSNAISSIKESAPPLVKEVSANTFRIFTLAEGSYLVDDPTFDRCPYHNWGTCRAEGSAVGVIPITAQSSNPPCYFPSGSAHHCSHAAIFTTRQSKCLLLKFEEYLCCRRCAFLHRCWPDRSIMPCKTAGAH